MRPNWALWSTRFGPSTSSIMRSSRWLNPSWTRRVISRMRSSVRRSGMRESDRTREEERRELAMCYDSDARPPLPPIAGGSGGDGTDLQLSAADGNRFAAYSARAGTGTGGPGMVILPDVRGLHRFYRELALRFAEAGIHAIALDYFGRTAGLGPRDEGFEYMPHVMQTEPDTIAADVAAAAAHVRSPDGGAATAVFT